ncbi:MAG TPA: methyltransferase domain-containing protein [Pyrinomonadaceae bacterium]
MTETVLTSAECAHEARARSSEGRSDHAIYAAVARALDERGAGGELLVDVGCGNGRLWPYVRARFARCVGVDLVRYEGLPHDVEFVRAELNGEALPLADGSADAVVSAETIEHLENPRAFMRELARVVRPGGWVVVTTPNQLSLLSLLTLVVKRRHAAFQDVHYPAHLTALLEVDLRRIAAECGLHDVTVEYTGQGRVVLTPWHYPRFLARLAPRLCSDNLLMIGRKH